ncbi:MAG: porin family protein [Eudoraea sp.]|nr:porin family protein [Eudoraea sp.]
MRKLILFSLLSLFAFTTYAQGDVVFGVRGGVNFTNISGDDTEEFSSRTGIQLGFLAEFGLTDMLALRPELNFSMQGAELSEPGFEGKIKLNYLNIPVMLKVDVADGFFFEAGPQLGFLMSAKEEFDEEGESGEEDIKNEVKDIDFGGNLGLGYELDSGLFFNARYNIGFSDINEEEPEKNQNSVFSIAVGFMF